MTKKELIEALAEFDDNAGVDIRCGYIDEDSRLRHKFIEIAGIENRGRFWVSIGTFFFG